MPVITVEIITLLIIVWVKIICVVLRDGNTALIKDGVIPDTIKEMGEVNTEFCNWTSICLDPSTNIYVSSGATGNIIQYDSEGNSPTEYRTCRDRSRQAIVTG